MSNPTALVVDPENAGVEVREFVDFRVDDAGQTFATVVLANGDVIDTDALDVIICTQ